MIITLRYEVFSPYRNGLLTLPWYEVLIATGISILQVTLIGGAVVPAGNELEELLDTRVQLSLWVEPLWYVWTEVRHPEPRLERLERFIVEEDIHSKGFYFS